MIYEYRVVPAPTKGMKAKGVKTPEARFALALETLMTEMGAEGWEYQRADTLPSVERTGLTGSTTTWRHLLIFRRPAKAEEPPLALPPVIEQPKAPEESAADQVSRSSDSA